MQFSIVIPSRNRSRLLRVAIESVLAQDFDDYEVVVANDGSDGEHYAEYRAMANEWTPRVRFIDLEHTAQGHGSSYAINMGAAAANGRFLTFLDDDDFWTDPGHLGRTHNLLSGDGSDSIDAVYAEQQAVRDGQPVTELLWLNGLAEELRRSGVEPISINAKAVEVTVSQLLTQPTFGHLNTSVIRRSLFEQIGGLDNDIRYENDRDFYLRTIDNARRIVLQTVSIAQHNVPDRTRKDNLSTAVSALQKHLYQLQVDDKVLLFARHPEIRAAGRTGKAYTLRRMARILAAQQNHPEAACYAWQALGTRFTFKWLVYSSWLGIRGLVLTNAGGHGASRLPTGEQER